MKRLAYQAAVEPRDQQHMRLVLEAIERCWSEYPEMSLAQLLVVKLRPAKPMPELFRLTDEELLGIMRFDCHDPERLSSP